MKSSKDLTKEGKMTILKEAFELFDTDNDGQITIDEIKSFFDNIGDELNRGEIQDMINEVDVDGNGTITFDAFRGLIDRKLRNEKVEEEIIETFKKFDKDNDGLISANDIYELMKMFGQGITKPEAEEMVKNVDLDGDGFVNYQEFVKMLFE